MGEAGLRFFGVGSDEFLRGTILPPAQIFAPHGHAAGRGRLRGESRARSPGCRPGNGLRPRPAIPSIPAAAGEAAADHARHFLTGWLGFASSGPREPERRWPGRSRVVHLAAHDLATHWPPGRGGRVARAGPRADVGLMDELAPVSLGGYLDRNPAGCAGQARARARRDPLRATRRLRPVRPLPGRGRPAHLCPGASPRLRRPRAPVRRPHDPIACSGHSRWTGRFLRVMASMPRRGSSAPGPPRPTSTGSPARSRRAAPTAGCFDELDRGSGFPARDRPESLPAPHAERAHRACDAPPPPVKAPPGP